MILKKFLSSMRAWVLNWIKTSNWWAKTESYSPATPLVAEAIVVMEEQNLSAGKNFQIRCYLEIPCIVLHSSYINTFTLGGEFHRGRNDRIKELTYFEETYYRRKLILLFILFYVLSVIACKKVYLCKEVYFCKWVYFLVMKTPSINSLRWLLKRGSRPNTTRPLLFLVC